MIFRGQNGENLSDNGVEKHVFYERRILSNFFLIFAILARFWEALEPPKINKKLKNRVRDASGTHLGFSFIFGSVLGGFGEGLGTVSEGFLKFFGRNFRGIWEDKR